MNGLNNYQTLKVRWEDTICYIQMYRPQDNNTINDTLIQECSEAIDECQNKATVVVLEGLKETFCFGADFNAMAKANSENSASPEPLYDLWLKLAQSSFVSVAHVEGKANAGGIGFVAACDLVFASDKSVFSLSELLFGLMPACVLPFLIRKVGFQKAHAMTLMTKPVSVEEAHNWGLVDKYDANSSTLLRRSLLRLRRLNKNAIERYKRYMNALDTTLNDHKSKALNTNLEVFNDSENRAKIKRYIETGQFPWE